MFVLSVDQIDERRGGLEETAEGEMEVYIVKDVLIRKTPAVVLNLKSVVMASEIKSCISSAVVCCLSR